MNRITKVHILYGGPATPAIQCALRLFDSFTSETTKINYQFLNVIVMDSLETNVSCELEFGLINKPNTCN